MPQLQNLVLTDRATTPVAHTFTPRAKEGNDGGRVVKAGVSAVADMQFTIEPRRTPQGRFKVNIGLVVPIVQNKVENGVSSYIVTRASRVNVTFDFAGDSTEQERKDLVGMIASAFDPSKVLVNDVLIKTDSVF